MATQISSLTTLVNNANSYDCFLPLVDPTLALNSRNVKVRVSTQDQLFTLTLREFSANVGSTNGKKQS